MNDIKVTVFGENWCTGCKQLRGVLEMNQVVFKYVDLDLNPEYIEKYSITKLPTTIVESKKNNTTIIGNEPMMVIELVNSLIRNTK